VVHLAAHCVNGKKLLLEDAEGAAHPVDADALAELFAAHGEHVRLIVLAACDSEQVGKRLVGRRRSVIATRGKVRDKVATFFTHALYQALSTATTTAIGPGGTCMQRRRPLSVAFRVAQSAVRMSPDFDGDKDAKAFLLLMQVEQNDPIILDDTSNHELGGRPTPPLIAGRRSSSVSSTGDVSDAQAASDVDHRLPALCEDFVGRNVDVYRTLRAITRRRLVLLVSGDKDKGVANDNQVDDDPEWGRGIGKSSLAVAVAHHLHRRRTGTSPASRWCEDGVVFVRGATTTNDICCQWLQRICHSGDDSASNTGTDISGFHEGLAHVGGSNSDGVNTPPIVRLMRQARLRQRCLVVLDECETALRGTRGKAFLNSILQALPHVRFLITAHVSPFDASGSPLAPGCSSPLGFHDFKPLQLKVGGLSARASAKLLMRRAHRPIYLLEALDGGEEDFVFPGSEGDNAESCIVHPQRSVETALSRHPLICQLRGHPTRICSTASQVTPRLPNLSALLGVFQHHRHQHAHHQHSANGAEKLCSVVAQLNPPQILRRRSSSRLQDHPNSVCGVVTSVQNCQSQACDAKSSRRYHPFTRLQARLRGMLARRQLVKRNVRSADSWRKL